MFIFSFAHARVTNLVTLIYKLMRTRDCREAVDVVELGGHLVAEEPTGAAGAHGPGVYVFRITPYKIAESTLVGNLLSSGNNADLINGANLRAQATVHTEYSAVDNGGQDKEVKDLTAGLPNGGVAVLLLTLLIESIDLGDLARLVVATNQYDPIGISRDRVVSEAARIG